jgi:addiction module RelE/StbE family toxin
MLALHFSSRFKRSYRKRPEWIKAKVRERLRMFAQDPTHELLRDHPLGGVFKGTRSFSLTGDLRVHYEYVSDTLVNLIDMGTHAELYGT